MRTLIAILAGAVLIAAAILFTFRWEMVAGGNVAYLRDRWTGDILVCPTPVEAELTGMPVKTRCEPK